MILKVATWNLQGSPFNNKQKLKDLKFLSKKCDVLCLQEYGAFHDVRFKKLLPGFSCCYIGHPGALNNRCSTAIITKSHLLGTKKKLGTVCSTISGRSVSYVKLKCDVTVANAHCTADGKAFDRNHALKLLHRKLGHSPLILAGDFNCQPGTEPQINVGTTKRPIFFKVCKSNYKTHRHGGELDYQLSQNVRILSGRSLSMSTSDHDPVIGTYKV